MKKHQFFDLQMLEDDEIRAVVGHPVVSREVLQQWPLSCVEKITTSNETPWILKSNREPCDTEGHFYESINHSAIIKPRYILHHPPCQSILYSYVDGTPYSLVNLNKKIDVVDCFQNDFRPILRSIDQPKLPAYLKLDTEKTFSNTFNAMLLMLTRLVETGKYSHVSLSNIEKLKKIINSKITQKIANTNTGLVHGDFSVDNILVTNTNAIVILDWQRPIYGSTLIDEYSFVKSQNFTPDPPASLMGSLVQIYWLTDCSVNWYPVGIQTYDRQIKGLLNDLLAAYEAISTNQTSM